MHAVSCGGQGSKCVTRYSSAATRHACTQSAVEDRAQGAAAEAALMAGQVAALQEALKVSLVDCFNGKLNNRVHLSELVYWFIEVATLQKALKVSLINWFVGQLNNQAHLSELVNWLIEVVVALACVLMCIIFSLCIMYA